MEHIWCKILSISYVYDHLISKRRYDPDCLRMRVKSELPYYKNVSIAPTMAYFYEMIKNEVSLNLFETFPCSSKDENDCTRVWIGFQIRGFDIYARHYYFNCLEEDCFDLFNEQKITIVDMFHKYGGNVISHMGSQLGWPMVLKLVNYAVFDNIISDSALVSSSDSKHTSSVLQIAAHKVSH